jgi:hypothetical protein
VKTTMIFRHPTARRLLSRGVAVTVAALLAGGSLGPVSVAAPVNDATITFAQHQNVDWMSSGTASYLGSIGMSVMVPSWVPSPFTGVAPDVYAGGGSYSLYWMAPGTPPTFLHITGVVGGGLPDGSKADLNIPLSINTEVQGWPAIRDIGVPAGSSTPIYDQVWWIADGVRYSVESNNIGTDSLTIANSMLLLTAPAPVEPTAPPVVEPPYVPPTAPPTAPPVAETPVWQEPVTQSPTAPPPVSTSPGPDAPAPTSQPVTGSSSAPSAETGGSGGGSTLPTTSVTSGETSSGSAGTSTSSSDESEDAPWSPSKMDAGFPSDGTAGPRPPVIGGDGTGGLYDTSLPRIMFDRP